MQGAFGFPTNSSNGDLSSALRWYEKTRRRKVMAVSRGASLQVSRSESVLRPAALIPDRFMTKALTGFLSSVSHRRMSRRSAGTSRPRSTDPWRCGDDDDRQGATRQAGPRRRVDSPLPVPAPSTAGTRAGGR